MTTAVLDKEEQNKCINSNQPYTDSLTGNFYNKIFKDNEKLLIKLAFKPEAKQEELDNILKSWTKDNNDLLLLYFQKTHPDMHFEDQVNNRLKGLLLNYRLKNIQTVSHFSKIGKALNKNEIKPMIIKGGVMKYLRPELPRTMGDVDILVKENQFMKAADITTSLGYWYGKIDIHSIDIHESEDKSEDGILDIHRFVYFETGKEKEWLKGLFERAEEKTVFGVSTLVPSFEDLMFITLTNLTRNLRNKTSQAGLPFTLFDCKYFLEQKPDFNWDIVKENARKTNTEVQINLAIKFIDKISEDIIPENIKNNLDFETETDDFAAMILYKRFYLEEIRTRCRAMKIGHVLKNPSEWADYVLLKPKYALMKNLVKHPKLTKRLIKDLNREYCL